MKASFRKPIIFLLIVLCECFSVASAAKKRKTRISAIVKDAQICNDYSHPTLNYTFHGKDDYRVNLSFDVKEPLVDLGMTNMFERCEGQSIENCENFMTVPSDDICSYLDDKSDQLWSGVLTKIEPKLECPIQGFHSLREFKILELVEKVTAFGNIDAKSDRYQYRWTMRVTQNPTKTEVFCVTSRVYFRQTRVS